MDRKMNFQNTAALTWILPLSGVIIVLYILRMKRKDVVVPARFLWPERTDEVRANALFQKLRINWLLFLQLLALALIVIALARPQSLQSGLAGEVTVIVLDASASMGATDVAPNRFFAAMETAKGIIESAGATDQIMLIEAGPVPRVVFPLSSDTSAQLHALKTVRRSDAPADTGEALRLATSRVGEVDGSKIVLLSDGVFPHVENFASGKSSLVYQKFGEERVNLSIESLGTTEGVEGRAGYAGIKNCGLDQATVSLDIFADGKLIDSQKSVIEPSKTWGKEFAVSRESKIIEAKIKSNDFLPADDYAVSIINPGAKLNVLLISQGDPFLESALTLDPRVTLDKTTTLPETEKIGSLGLSAYDIVIFEGLAEQAVKAKGVLTLGVSGVASPVISTGRTKNFTFLDSTSSDLVKGVDFKSIYIENIENIKPKSIGRTIVEGTNGPLIVTADGAKRQIFVAFAPLDSDFPLTVSFPIFISNALDFLAERSKSNTFAIRAGQQFQIAAKTDSIAILSRPDGTQEKIEPLQGRYIVRGVDKIGEYSLEIDKTVTKVYADMRDATESQIDPQEFVSITKGKVASVKNLRRYADFWRPLILIGLLVLATEWWLYARRS